MRERDYATNPIAGLSLDTHGHSGGTTSNSHSSPATTAPSTPSHTSPASPVEAAEGHHQIPGEAFIDRDEHAGLPGTTDLEGYANKRAKAVVRQHTGKKRYGWALFSGGGGSRTDKVKAEKAKKEKMRKSNQDKDEEKSGEEGDSDLEAASEPMHAPLRMGGGVLAALLTLYNQNNDGAQSTTHSRNGSSSNLSAFSAATSRRSSFDEGPPRPSKPWLKDPKAQKPKISVDPSSGVGATGGDAAAAGGGAAAGKKRPGFMLSRLSLESNLPTRKSLASLAMPTLRRPASTHFGRDREEDHLNPDSKSGVNRHSPTSVGSRTPSSGAQTPARLGHERNRDSMSIGGSTLEPSHSGHEEGKGKEPGSKPGMGGRKWTGMLNLKDLKNGAANSSLYSLKSMAGIGVGMGLAGVGLTPTAAPAKSVASSEVGTPTTDGEGEVWDEKWMMREREREKERKRKDEKRRKKKEQAFVSIFVLFTSSILKGRYADYAPRS